ncbi:MAG: ATP-binding protein [Chloroflexota bacterium]
MARGTQPAFSSLLRQFRNEAELTQEERAGRAQISVRAISDLERGRHQAPYDDTVERLCDALRLDARDREILFSSISRRRGSRAGAYATPISSSLPADLTPLVGREHEQAAVVHLLQSSSTRLLTLIGPGGVGKTRLALRVAESLAGAYAGGIWFVSLAPVTTPARVATAIAAALDVRDVRDRTTEESLIERLRDGEVLLILDNFEHVADAATLVSRLLLTCPGLTVLITSRASLHISGEHLLDVPPLRLPDSNVRLLAAVALQYSAVTLFTQRARALRADFTLTEDVVAPVTTICQHLDGLPLAIELAAAQIRHLAPAELLTRLEHSVINLPLGPIDLPPRQQTMRATVAWSYELLSTAEQRLFRHLSVFRGGWSLAAAEAVAGESAEDAFGLLTALSDKSLVTRHDGDSDERFSMLETVREYGSEVLASHGEEEDAHRRHATYFLRLVQETQRAVREHGAAAWSSRLLPDRNNTASALQWLATDGYLEEALALAAGLVEYWLFWGQVRQGRAVLQQLLRLAGEHADGAVRVSGSALRAAGRLAWIQAEYAEATVLYEQAMNAFHEEGDLGGQATTFTNLGTVAHLQSQYAQASSYYRQGLALAGEVGDRFGMAQPLSNLGLIAMQQGKYQEAATLLDGALALWRGLGNDHMVAVTLANRANLAFRQGSYDEAGVLQVEALALKRTVGDPLAIAHSLGDLAWVEIERGQYKQARSLLGEALDIFQDLGQKVSFAECLEALARIAFHCYDPTRSAVLYGAAAALREQVGATHHPADLPRHEAAIQDLRAAMNPCEFQAAWDRGLSLPLDRAMAAAMTVGSAS